MKTISVIFVLSMIPALVTGQSADPAIREGIDALLDDPEVNALLASLDERYVEHFLMLVPDLAPENRDALDAAVASAFQPSSLRDILASALATEASAEWVARLVEMRRTGSQAELRRVARDGGPGPSFDAASPSEGDRGRLQLMVALTEARRLTDLDLILDEEMRRLAHELVASLGGALGDFEPMPDEQFDAAYRDRTIRLAIESFSTLRSASDELVQAAVDEHLGEPAQWFADAYTASVVAAVQSAARGVAAVTVPDAPAEPETTGDAASGLPCHAHACGFVVEWEGPEPSGTTAAYGAPGDLERLVLGQLVGAGYQLVRGPLDGGMTVRLRARSSRVYCEAMSGTDNRVCLAVGRVRVEFTGVHPGVETPGSFIVQNRCRANAVMHVQGIAGLVAARIHHQLTTSPGDERPVPRC